MAAPLPFISTQDLSDFIGQDAVNAKGTIVVDAACDICRTKAEQTFTEAGGTITMDGSGTEIQLLPEYPVGTINTVLENGGSLTNGDYVLDPATGSLLRVPSGQAYSTADVPVWKLGRQNVVVDYDHGWVPEDFPSDVRMVALSIAKRLYELPEGDLSSESLGSRSVSYRDGGGDLSKNEIRILEKYRRY
jgi:hypothetical protein